MKSVILNTKYKHLWIWIYIFFNKSKIVFLKVGDNNATLWALEAYSAVKGTEKIEGRFKGAMASLKMLAGVTPSRGQDSNYFLSVSFQTVP